MPSRAVSGDGVANAYILSSQLAERAFRRPLYLITDPPHPPTVCAFGRAQSDRAHLGAIAAAIMAINGLKIACPPGIVPLHVDARDDLARTRERIAKGLRKYRGRRIMFLVEGDSYEQAFEGEWLHLLPQARGFIGPARAIKFTPEGEPVDCAPAQPGGIKAALASIKQRAG